MPSDTEDTFGETDLGHDTAVKVKKDKKKKAKKEEDKPSEKETRPKKHKAKKEKSKKHKVETASNGFLAPAIDQEQDAAAEVQKEKKAKKVSPVLPTIREFFENPAKTAEEWLNSLPIDRRFKLLPHSDTQTVFKTLMEYVKRLQDTDDDDESDTAEPQSKNMNEFLEGVRGVGKTRTVQAVCQFIDAMRECYGSDFHVVSFYYNCEEAGDLRRPRVLLVELLNNYIPGFSKGSYKDMRDVVCAALEHEIRLFVVFDEVQCKYVPHDDDCFHDNHAFVVDVLQLGKSCGYVATVITGSSARAKHFAFHHVKGLEPAAQFVKDYPNLNSTVFHVSAIRPVRDKDAFTKVVNPEGRLDDASVSSRFYFSGGVARHLTNTEAPPCSAESYFGNYDFPLHRAVVLCLLWANRLLQDKNGKVAVNEERVNEIRTNPWSLSPLHADVLLSLLRPHIETPVRILHTMFDENLLDIYQKTGGLFDDHRASFLYPCHAVNLARCAAADMN